MGLARNHPFILAPEEGVEIGPLYIEYLANAGIIPENKFSFYFNPPGFLSFVDLGVPQEKHFRPGTPVAEIQLLEEDFFWGAYCQGVAVGDTTAINRYAWAELSDYKTWQPDHSLYSILDTGSSAIMISSLYFESLMQEIFARVPNAMWEFIDEEGVVLTECNHDFPSLFFMFDGHWLEASPRDYVFAIDDNREQCIFFIMPANMAMNIIGMPVFVDYYMAHEPDTGIIRVAPHTTSNKFDIMASNPPTRKFLEVISLGLQVNATALFISWILSLILLYGMMEYWSRFLRPAWQQALSSTAYLAMSVVFFAGVISLFMFLI